jgi:D-tyrosyl-tRNA(Tyr) deacylase
MVAVIQRCSKSSVKVDNEIIARIESGLIVLLGVCSDDSIKDVDYIANKIVTLRIFNDQKGKMNLSINETSRSVIIVSQFTLCANIKKGSRPSFLNAAPPKIGEELYKHLISSLTKSGLNVQTGKFGAMMDVQLVNNGPATFIIDSKV